MSVDYKQRSGRTKCQALRDSCERKVCACEPRPVDVTRRNVDAARPTISPPGVVSDLAHGSCGTTAWQHGLPAVREARIRTL